MTYRDGKTYSATVVQVYSPKRVSVIREDDKDHTRPMVFTLRKNGKWAQLANGMNWHPFLEPVAVPTADQVSMTADGMFQAK